MFVIEMIARTYGHDPLSFWKAVMSCLVAISGRLSKTILRAMKMQKTTRSVLISLTPGAYFPEEFCALS